MINKHNLAVTFAASRGASSRYTLNGILVRPDATVATDGYRLAWVSTSAGVKSESFPRVDGVGAPSDTFAPFILATDTATKIAKTLPRKSTIPVLKYAAVTEETVDGKYQPALTVTDLQSPQTFRPSVPAGTFPNFDTVMPKWADAKFRVGVNASYLAEIAKAFAAFADDKQRQHVVLSFYDAEKPVRFDGVNEQTGQGMTVLLMPVAMENSEAQPRRTYGWTETDATPADAESTVARRSRRTRPAMP